MPTNERESAVRGPADAGGRIRARPGAGWEARCAALFEDLRKPARVLIRRAYGSAFSTEEIEDVYSNAWASTLAALRGRADRMDDEELRSYLLTAVANHASKEMRRRSRKPTSALEDAHAQVLADSHQPSPDERALGSHSRNIARDVLASLPPRRRAVMLLRYGWGLEPKQVCAMVAGLSPRAYRKEITRGVEEMIARLGAAEEGGWCRSREPIIRDYVAGTASEQQRLQARSHLAHCQGCGELAGRLSGGLNDLGAGVAWTSIAGTLGPDRAPLGGLLERGRELAAKAGGGRGEGLEAVADAAGRVAASGGARGGGAAGAGIASKLLGVGAAGKLALGCVGAGVAVSACLATGVVPGTGGGEQSGERPRPGWSLPVDSVQADGAPVPVAIPESGTGGGEGDGEESSRDADRVETKTAPEGAPVASPAPTAPPEQQEFGLAAAGTASSGGGSGGGASSGGGGPSGEEAAREFGP